MDRVHHTWHNFYKWLFKTFGKDLIETRPMDIGDKTVQITHYNDYELSKRLVGYEVIEKIERYVRQSKSDIKVVSCDDAMYAGSIILLIPHPSHGITMMYIPQCTNVQNQLFLYDNHFKNLTKELSKMSKVYK